MIADRPMQHRDLQAVCNLLNESQHFDGVAQVVQLDELEELLTEEGDLTENVRLAELDGEVVGMVRTVHLPSETAQERCYLFGTVRPELRGKGIGTLLMEWAVPRGTALLLSSSNALPKFLRVEATDTNTAAHRFFERLGFASVRVFEELLRPLDELPPWREPVGVHIVPWPTTRDEEIRLAKNLAFADHWGSTPTSPSRWQLMVHGFGNWTERSFIALDDDDHVVAHCHNQRYPADDELLGRRDGWISSLGTLREWRGRGIGSTLVVRSLHAFADAGMTHASIGVDGDSLTGAAQLYRSLGFEVVHRAITLQIEVSRPA